MAVLKEKWLGKSDKYKHVFSRLDSAGNLKFIGYVKGKRRSGFKTEREAAVWVDKELISRSMEPVNVLKRK